MDRKTEKPGIRGLTIMMHFGYRTMRMRTRQDIYRPMWLQKIGWSIARFGLRIMTGKIEWEFKKI